MIDVLRLLVIGFLMVELFFGKNACSSGVLFGCRLMVLMLRLT